ncbi:MAG: LPS assembly lipoprotein LptE [Thermodesulfobacteriota bacterium]
MTLNRISALLLILALAGCGYRPLGLEPYRQEAQPVLSIPPFANRSTEVGVETVMANALIQAFAQTKAVRLTTKPQDAELVLEGKVAFVENSSVAFNSILQSTVRRVTIKVDLTLKRRHSGKTVWKDTTVIQEDYLTDPNYQIGETLKDQGLRRAADKLAQRVLDKVLLVI